MDNALIWSDEDIDMKSFPVKQKGDRTAHSGVMDGRVKSPRSQSYHFTERQLCEYTKRAIEGNRPPFPNATLTDAGVRKIVRETWFSVMNPNLKALEED